MNEPFIGLLFRKKRPHLTRIMILATLSAFIVICGWLVSIEIGKLPGLNAFIDMTLLK